MARLFDVSLAARQYSARLQAFHQLAEDSAAELAAAAGAASRPCCWALLGGRAYTDAQQLRETVHAALTDGVHAAEGGVGAVYPFDHVYASPAAASAPPLNITAPGTIPVELFAPIGSRCGAQLHEVLAGAAARSDAAAAAAAAAGAPPPPRLAYAWRPLLDAAACGGSEVHACTRLGTGDRLVLPGYGVELALKNMEYNAQDDKKDVRTARPPRAGPGASGPGCGACRAAPLIQAALPPPQRQVLHEGARDGQAGLTHMLLHSDNVLWHQFTLLPLRRPAPARSRRAARRRVARRPPPSRARQTMMATTKKACCRHVPLG